MNCDKARIEILVGRLEAAAFTPEVWDDVVHAAADELATSANNGGLHEQARFLISTCGLCVDEAFRQVSEMNETLRTES